MESPYNKVLANYSSLKDIDFTCTPKLALDTFKAPKDAGSSASGMILGTGDHTGIPVFVKIFAMPCNYRTFDTGTRVIQRKRIVFDKNALEIGITKFLSDLLMKSDPFTQNLVAVYKTRKCSSAFEPSDELSSVKCNDKCIPYLISKAASKTPQHSLMSQYEQGQWDDQVNFMVVEHCDGDLEHLFNILATSYKEGRISEELFNANWNSIFLQIVLTIAMLDEIFGGFHHNDLGPRNILFCKNDKYHNKYFEYKVKGTTFYIEDTGIIPKLWDFSYIHLNEHSSKMLKESGNFDYLRPDDVFETAITEKIPNIVQLCTQIITLPTFQYIENTTTGTHIKAISQRTNDDFNHYISLFNTFVPSKDHSVSEPPFSFSY